LATTSTATTTFGSTVTNLVVAKILQNLRAGYAYGAPGNYREEDFENGTNGTFVWTTYADQAAQTTALTEGTPPTAQELSISTESATAKQYGGTFEITDLAQLQNPHNLIAVASDHAADQAAKTIDTLIRDIVVAGSSVFYGSGATSRATVATTSVLTASLVKRMAEELGTLNVRPFPDGMYRCIIHPRQAADLQRDTSTGGFVQTFQYAKPDPLINSAMQIGEYGGFRFLITSNTKVFATAGASSANVYAGVFFGQDAYGVGWEQRLNAYFVPAGGSLSDPLAQKAILGWKTAFAAKLLTGPGQQLLRLETGATNG
jgi:N4-gp56 family major capsid protein